MAINLWKSMNSMRPLGAEAFNRNMKVIQDAINGMAEGTPGPTGPTGPANTLTIGTVQTVAPGGSATAQITGEAPSQILNLGIPSGLTGAAGPAGETGANGANAYVHVAYATDAVGTGFSKTVSIGKSYIGVYTDNNSAGSDSYLDYTWLLFRGEKGDTGDTGPTGPEGPSGAPIGSGMEWYTTTPPTGWLLQNGAAISRTTHAALFAIIGTIFGAGDGSTTFNLPNRSGYVPIGVDSTDSNFDAVGKKWGEKSHTLSAAEEAAHSHSIDHDHPNTTSTGQSQDHSHAVNIQSGGESANHTHKVANGAYRVTGTETSSYYYFTNGGSGGAGAQTSGIESVAHSHNVSGNTAGMSVSHSHDVNIPNYTGSSGNNSGAGSAHNNMQPSMAVYYIIKAL